MEGNPNLGLATQLQQNKIQYLNTINQLSSILGNPEYLKQQNNSVNMKDRVNDMLQEYEVKKKKSINSMQSIPTEDKENFQITANIQQQNQKQNQQKQQIQKQIQQLKKNIMQEQSSEKKMSQQLQQCFFNDCAVYTEKNTFQNSVRFESQQEQINRKLDFNDIKDIKDSGLEKQQIEMNKKKFLDLISPSQQQQKEQNYQQDNGVRDGSLTKGLQMLAQKAPSMFQEQIIQKQKQSQQQKLQQQMALNHQKQVPNHTQQQQKFFNYNNNNLNHKQQPSQQIMQKTSVQQQKQQPVIYQNQLKMTHNQNKANFGINNNKLLVSNQNQMQKQNLKKQQEPKQNKTFNLQTKKGMSSSMQILKNPVVVDQLYKDILNGNIDQDVSQLKKTQHKQSQNQNQNQKNQVQVCKIRSASHQHLKKNLPQKSSIPPKNIQAIQNRSQINPQRSQSVQIQAKKEYNQEKEVQQIAQLTSQQLIERNAQILSKIQGNSQQNKQQNVMKKQMSLAQFNQNNSLNNVQNILQNNCELKSQIFGLQQCDLDIKQQGLNMQQRSHIDLKTKQEKCTSMRDQIQSYIRDSHVEKQNVKQPQTQRNSIQIKDILQQGQYQQQQQPLDQTKQQQQQQQQQLQSQKFSAKSLQEKLNSITQMQQQHENNSKQENQSINWLNGKNMNERQSLWQENKKQKCKILKNSLDQREIEKCTFQPQINNVQNNSSSSYISQSNFSSTQSNSYKNFKQQEKSYLKIQQQRKQVNAQQQKQQKQSQFKQRSQSMQTLRVF